MVGLSLNQNFSCNSPSLQGGETLLQGGEYMIQAVNAVALNVAILADSFNAKLANINDDIRR